MLDEVVPTILEGVTRTGNELLCCGLRPNNNAPDEDEWAPALCAEGLC